MTNCTRQNIIESINYCKFVKENCESGLIDFYRLNYCVFDNNLYISLPIFLIICNLFLKTGIISFYLLSDTANKYLSSALTTLAERLNISQNLAGVTFLAFGNGAPDIISSFVASDSTSSGIDFSVGALVGSGIFITSFVVSSVIFYAKSVKVNRDMFIRDIAIYVLTLILLMIFSLDGKISLWETICFFILYSAYIIIAFIQDRNKKNKKSEDKKEGVNEMKTDNDCYYIKENGKIIKEEATEKEQIDKSLITYRSSIESIGENKDQENQIPFQNENNQIDKDKENDECEDGRTKRSLSGSYLKTFLHKKELMNEQYFYKDHNHQIQGSNEIIIKPKRAIKLKKQSIFEFQLDSLKYKMKKWFFSTDYENKNIFEKIVYFVIELPFNILRDLSIPPCEKENWKQQFFIIMPLTITLFIIISFNQWEFIIDHIYVSSAIIILVILLIILFYFTTYRNRPPKSIIVLCIASFIMSILWIYFIAKVLLDILNIVGDLLNIPSVFLGMTLLAIGNSAPAKSGFGEMGISGSIAGPLFNLLIGLGSSVLKLTLQSPDYSVEFELFDKKNFLILICIIFLIVNLVRLLIQALILKFKLSLSVSYIGYIIYFIFFAFTLYHSFFHGN